MAPPRPAWGSQQQYSSSSSPSSSSASASCCAGGGGGCCGCGDRSGGAVPGTVALGVSLGLSFILLVVSGAVYKDFLPFINVAFVVLLPVAVIIGDMYKTPKFLRDQPNERAAVWANFGACTMGLIVVSMFALPLVLLHVQQLSAPGFGLWMASTVISAASAIFFFMARQYGTHHPIDTGSG
jgi:hypothetical protein